MAVRHPREHRPHCPHRPDHPGRAGRRARRHHPRRGPRRARPDPARRAPADELELPRLHHLLTLAAHPLAAQVDREARTLGLHLDAVPAALPTPFAGRETELAALGALLPGQVAWVSGHAGMGKTALLDALARAGGWTVLPGRADLPFGTLAPLCAAPPTSAHAALGALRDPQVRVAVDGWEGTDPGTQAP
ncbi:ATP-binding protein [Deinococcus caeni]|uniref:ATP-binding protein n=1 Tax=Deinococcus caeni TaxID=569127 RepID=UPI00360CB8A4